MVEIEFGYSCGNLDFEVFDDGSIVARKLYPRYRKLAIWIKPLWRLFTRKVSDVKIEELQGFIRHYDKTINKKDHDCRCGPCSSVGAI